MAKTNRVPYKLYKIRYMSLWKKIKNDATDEHQKGNRCTYEDVILRILKAHYDKQPDVVVTTENSATEND